jgi:hypothetical protein
VRNYIARSWLFSPPKERSGKYGRTVGAQQSLDTDIMNVSAEELTRMKDQIMHDLLVYIVASTSIKNNG